MTVTAISVGLLPVLWSTGIGADTMKRIAAPMVGGVFSSFLMELLVYPAIYEIWKWNFELRPRLDRNRLLVFALSVPFWLIGAASGIQILPGLPVSSLGAFCPLMAASILVYRENKTEGVKELLKRAKSWAGREQRIFPDLFVRFVSHMFLLVVRRWFARAANHYSARC
jgi:hypothetical protein